jgi:serine/threonine protein kinase
MAQAIDCVLQAARGLAYAHGQGAVHRDIKPGNLLLATDGTIRILDFGLARIDEPNEPPPPGATLAERLTRRGQMLGTVDYISPEQATDTRSADHRSDIYSLGCTLYRLVTARPMYEGKTAIAKLMCHYESEIPSLGESAEKVSPLLDRIFHKMVAKRPEDRYQSMAEVIEHLEMCLKAEESVVRDTVTLTPTGSGDDDYSGPEEMTIGQSPSTSHGLDRTTPFAESPPGAAPAQGDAGSSERTQWESATAVMPRDGVRPAAKSSANEPEARAVPARAEPPEMMAETTVSPKEKTVGPEAKTAHGAAPQVPAPEAPPVPTSGQAISSSVKLLFCAALAGAVLGGLLVAGLLYLLLG